MGSELRAAHSAGRNTMKNDGIPELEADSPQSAYEQLRQALDDLVLAVLANDKEKIQAAVDHALQVL